MNNRDFERLKKFKWFALGKPGNVYAAATIDGKTQKLHRVILGVTDPKVEVDHFDGDNMNNQRGNLRKATRTQNNQNAKIRKDNTSGVKGVHWSRKGAKALPGWTVRIQVNGKRLYVGKFITLEAATKAREEVATMYHKEFAYEKRK